MRPAPLGLVALLAALAATPAGGLDAPAAPVPPVAGSPPAGATRADAAGEDPLRAGVRGWYGLPVLFSTPETGLGYGALGGLHLGVREGLPTSSTEAVVYYTEREQAAFRIDWDLFPTSRLAVSGLLRAAEEPLLFFGIGPDTPESAREPYTNRNVAFQLAVERRLGPAGLRAGPLLQLRREVAVNRRAGGLLERSGLPGAGSFGFAAAGLQATWDRRDDLFRPRRGTFAQATYAYAPDLLGTGGAFGHAALDLRAFVPLPARLVLGLALRHEASHGDVPVPLLPGIGGGKTLRGYLDGRFVDRLSYEAQAELRVPLTWRFHGAVFAGAGRVGRSYASLLDGTPRPAAGAGLRFRLTDSGAAVRGDVAWGEEGRELYLLSLEAF